MTEKRFSLIMKCQHFVYNTTMPEVFTVVVQHFLTVHKPEQNIAVESLKLCQGRLAMKQYIPLKTAWFGLKL